MLLAKNKLDIIEILLSNALNNFEIRRACSNHKLKS